VGHKNWYVQRAIFLQKHGSDVAVSTQNIQCRNKALLEVKSKQFSWSEAALYAVARCSLFWPTLSVFSSLEEATETFLKAANNRTKAMTVNRWKLL